MKGFGLIGFPLTHSFSKKYFTQKFEKENIQGCVYELFEIESVDLFPALIASNPEVIGFNVTIPHKQNIIPFLSRLDDSAKFVGAVNVIKKETNGEWVGYNSDYYGFMESLKGFIPANYGKIKALILGTGGAAKAVEAALKTMNIDYIQISREAKNNILAYLDLSNELIETHKLIINTTPLGMYPNIDAAPALPYEAIGGSHFLFDLVYNPAETLFLKKGKHNGAKTQFGLEMLHFQAEKAWEIWNS